MGDAHTLLITPRDPLIFRDGRPFDSNLTTRISIHLWPPPSVTAGAIRTALGQQCGHFDSRKLNRLDIAGPLLLAGKEETLYVSAPADCLQLKGKEIDVLSGHALRPVLLDDGEGLDLPPGLHPLLPPLGTKTAKPDSSEKAAWWSLSMATKWLCGTTEQIRLDLKSSDCLKVLELEERTHVKIDSQTGTAEEGLLFTTRAVDFRQKGHSMPMQLALRVADIADTAVSDSLIPEVEKLNGNRIMLGGERRTAQLIVGDRASLWECPTEICNKLNENSKFIRMMLATPAIFKAGWRPEWIREKELVGTVPGSQVKVKLIAAAINRYQPVSGWSYSKSGPKQKATRKMTPAGSVYFFEIVEGRAEELVKCWLRPICGRSVLEPGCGLGADGFGLALWGIGTAPEKMNPCNNA